MRLLCPMMILVDMTYHQLLSVIQVASIRYPLLEYHPAMLHSLIRTFMYHFYVLFHHTITKQTFGSICSVTLVTQRYNFLFTFMITTILSNLLFCSFYSFISNNKINHTHTTIFMSLLLLLVMFYHFYDYVIYTQTHTHR